MLFCPGKGWRDVVAVDKIPKRLERVQDGIGSLQWKRPFPTHETVKAPTRHPFEGGDRPVLRLIVGRTLHNQESVQNINPVAAFVRHGTRMPRCLSPGGRGKSNRQVRFYLRLCRGVELGPFQLPAVSADQLCAHNHLSQGGSIRLSKPPPEEHVDALEAILVGVITARSEIAQTLMHLQSNIRYNRSHHITLSFYLFHFHPNVKKHIHAFIK